MVNKGKKRIAKLKTSSTLLLTKGKGEDEEAEAEEELKNEEPLKKKGKVIITKPSKPSTTVFTRRSRKKANKEGGDIIFSKLPPNFQDRLKELQARVGITNFKELKYEIRIDEEKKKIEDLVMDTMGKWKYSPN